MVEEGMRQDLTLLFSSWRLSWGHKACLRKRRVTRQKTFLLHQEELFKWLTEMSLRSSYFSIKRLFETSLPHFLPRVNCHHISSDSKDNKVISCFSIISCSLWIGNSIRRSSCMCLPGVHHLLPDSRGPRGRRIKAKKKTDRGFSEIKKQLNRNVFYH